MMELNESNWSEHTSQGLVLADFYTPTCGPCRMLAPVLEQIENIKVVKLNAAENWDLAAEYEISAVPTLVFLKDGKEVKRMLGFQSKEDLQAEVDKLL